MNSKAIPRFFQTTRWSVVRLATGTDDATASQALALCAMHTGIPFTPMSGAPEKSPHDAEDLTQEFFARLLEKNILAAADQEKGRLRTFLLKCLQNFLFDERDRAMALKRGAGVLTSFSLEWAEDRYATSRWTTSRRAASFSAAGRSPSWNIPFNCWARCRAGQGRGLRGIEAVPRFWSTRPRGALRADRHQPQPPGWHAEKSSFPPPGSLAETPFRRGGRDARRADAGKHPGRVGRAAQLGVTLMPVIFFKNIQTVCNPRPWIP